VTSSTTPWNGASLRKDESPPFRSVLVANRGEIAVRIIRACRELGMTTVAIYSDADAGAQHVRAADKAVRIGPAPATESYLSMDLIVEAALAAGAQAIHPGYGFLAERAAFAETVRSAGLVFVGPAPSTIAALGDKLGARRLAADIGVDPVPGTFQPAAVERVDAADAIVAAAEEIGFPLLVKAAAGGGGRGMRRVEGPPDLPAALAAGSAEAKAAFGDGSVYLERVVAPARHIEVQLLGDRFGTIVALGERDCSLQRRHQKLLEESPAPGLTDAERATLLDRAVRIGRAAGLENAATVEFLFDEGRRFWFLEVNTRLQVEHGVTELVADVDLVRAQFEIAAGRPLSAGILGAAQQAPHPVRHAIEVRLSAEDPEREFAPAPGTVGRWSLPAGPGIRVDSGVEAGDRVPPDYDPLLAKLLVVDADRPNAIRRLARALDEVQVTGVQTTLPFHRFVAMHPGFGEGVISTDWVDSEWTVAAEQSRNRALDRAAAAAALVVEGSRTPQDRDVDHADRHPKPPSIGPTTGWRTAGRSLAVDRWPR
jgi:acetyl/propionyl-CoA carboxylase alpha subunit